MSSDTLTNLQIVSPSVKLSDEETRRKYRFARDVGAIECPTSRVMFLGDRGVGKTCTKKLLLGKEHVDDHVSTMGIRTHVTETNEVNEDWKEVTNDSLKEYENSELKRALAFFCAFKDNHKFISSTGELIIKKVLNIGRFLLALSCISVISYGVIFVGDFDLHFTPMLLCCTAGLAFSTGNMVIGFNIGNGLSIVLVFAYFWTTHAGSLLTTQISNVSTRLVALAFFGGLAGWIVGFLLALGIGAGISIALCLMKHQQPDVLAMTFTSEETVPFDRDYMTCVLFMVSAFVGIFSQSLVMRNLSRWINYFIAPMVFISSVLLAKALTSGMTITHFYLSGFLFGTAFIYGQNDGRAAAWRLNIGHARRVLTDILGCLVGPIYGYCLGWTLPKLDWNLVLGLFGSVFCVVCELYRDLVKRRETVPVGLIRKMREEGHKHWPTKLYLLDCAGNSVYYNAHHIWMSRHSTYLVVFRLDNLRDNFDECLERILFWMNSVFAHARHRDARVFLVATHKMNVPDEGERNRLLVDLSNSLRLPYGGRLAKNRSKNHYVFTVDNREREYNDEDVQLLKSEVWDSAMEAEYTLLPNRVSWFAFLDVVRELKKSELEEAEQEERRHYDAIIPCQRLWQEVREPCHLKKETDFYRMLRYYNDCGEIYYDSRDPVLCKYVVTNPHLLVDAVSSLLQCESTVNNLPHRLEVDQEQLKMKGIATFRLLSQYLTQFEVDHRKLVRLLQSLDVVIPLSPKPGFLYETSDRYIVTFMLPLRQIGDVTLKDPDRIVIFDFNYFYPEPVFIHLLAKCYQLSFTTTNQYDIVVKVENIHMYKDEGVFYFGNGVQYSISLYRPNSKTNQIWIRIKALRSPDLLPDVYDFIQQMDALMQRICQRYFEFLEYKYLMVCDCSMDECREVRSDNPPPNVDVLTIVDHSHDAPDNLNKFPESTKIHFCQRDPNKTVKIGPNLSSDDTKMRTDPEYQLSSLPEGRVDAFISCCPEDRIFVQTDMVPFLENASAETFGKTTGEGISVFVNYYDNPNPNGSFWSARTINQEHIKQCRCVIAVCSVNYYRSTESRDVESAVLQQIPVIPIYLDNCDTLPCLEVLRGISYPKEAELLLESFYVPLIRAVRHHCEKQRREEQTQRGPVHKFFSGLFHRTEEHVEEAAIIL